MKNRQGFSSLNSPVVWIPDSIEEAWEIKQEFGTDSCFVAGGTLLQVHWKKGRPVPSHLISLERIKEMQESGKVLNVYGIICRKNRQCKIPF